MISMLLSNTTLVYSVITIIVLGVLYFIANKLGIKLILTMSKVINFIEDTLSSFKFENTQIKEIVYLVLQALEVMVALDSSADFDTKVDEGLIFIKNIAKEFNINISESEFVIIRNVLIVGFNFLIALRLNKSKLVRRTVIKYSLKL